MPFLESASSVSGSVDRLFLWFFGVSVVALFAITATILWFCYRYRRPANPEPVDIEGNVLLEVVWTVVPLVIFLVMFWFGWTHYGVTRTPPPDAMTVEVTGRQWAWDFKYPNGKKTAELIVALGRPVHLEMRSADVIHGLYIPAFRLKMDVIPGRTTSLWFTPMLLGSFDIQCTVICGVNHTYMLSKCRVLPEEEFRAWYFSPEPPGFAAATDGVTLSVGSPAASPPVAGTPGHDLLLKHDCLTCHTADGRTGVGPTFLGLAGSEQEFIVGAGEKRLRVDRDLIRRGIVEPDANRMKGYPPVMAAPEATPAEVDLMVEAILALGATGETRLE